MACEGVTWMITLFWMVVVFIGLVLYGLQRLTLDPVTVVFTVWVVVLAGCFFAIAWALDDRFM
jgi:hypothetical protein